MELKDLKGKQWLNQEEFKFLCQERNLSYNHAYAGDCATRFEEYISTDGYAIHVEHDLYTKEYRIL